MLPFGYVEAGERSRLARVRHQFESRTGAKAEMLKKLLAAIAVDHHLAACGIQLTGDVEGRQVLARVVRNGRDKRWLRSA